MDALRRLEVWKRGCRLSVDVYKALGTCPEWGFRNQISSSALSIPSNIAEGYERESVKERLQFLKIAKGSCGELWTQLWIGMEAGFLEQSTGRELASEAEELSKMLHGLMQHFRDATSSRN